MGPIRGKPSLRGKCVSVFLTKAAYNHHMVNFRNPHVCVSGVIGVIAFSLSACATELPPLIDNTHTTGQVVVGRIFAVITGETSRWHAPEVRLIEVENQHTSERFHVEIKSKDRHFAFVLPSGKYHLTRVQISEGPFMSMAKLDIAFSVGESPVTYLGTWRFGISSPRYGRMIVVSMVLEEGEMDQAIDFLHKQVPTLSEQPIVAMLPQPSQIEARLYEVMPYPRYKYLRRHLW